MTDDLLDRLAIRERRRARAVATLSALYGRRQELRGVSPVADVFSDAATWCV